MKAITKLCALIALATFISAGNVHAEEASQEAMKMEDMHDMMSKCKDMHKDGKMCEHETMEKCQENMKKGDCQKMMKETKAKDKTSKK